MWGRQIEPRTAAQARTENHVHEEKYGHTNFEVPIGGGGQHLDQRVYQQDKQYQCSNERNGYADESQVIPLVT